MKQSDKDTKVTHQRKDFKQIVTGKIINLFTKKDSSPYFAKIYQDGSKYTKIKSSWITTLS